MPAPEGLYKGCASFFYFASFFLLFLEQCVEAPDLGLGPVIASWLMS